MRSYSVFVSYVARKSVGGKAINSSAGRTVNVRAASQQGMVAAVLRRLQKFHKAVVTELKIIKV